MTSSWKCSQCGLVNFAADANCKRCGAAQVTPPAGIVGEDGYVYPPPPAGGIWRDKSTLVMTKEASLPDRCVKCNAPANGLRLKRKFSWHHPILYLIICGAALLYVIIALVVSKRATIYLGLCAKHFQRRRKMMMVGFGLMAASVLGFVVGVAYEYPVLIVLGAVAFLVSMVWLIVAARVVTVKKIDDRLVWLNGVNRNYLSQLAPWQGQA